MPQARRRRRTDDAAVSDVQPRRRSRVAALLQQGRMRAAWASARSSWTTMPMKTALIITWFVALAEMEVAVTDTHVDPRQRCLAGTRPCRGVGFGVGAIRNAARPHRATSDDRRREAHACRFCLRAPLRHAAEGVQCCRFSAGAAHAQAQGIAVQMLHDHGHWWHTRFRHGSCTRGAFRRTRAADAHSACSTLAAASSALPPRRPHAGDIERVGVPRLVTCLDGGLAVPAIEVYDENLLRQDPHHRRRAKSPSATSPIEVRHLFSAPLACDTIIQTRSDAPRRSLVPPQSLVRTTLAYLPHAKRVLVVGGGDWVPRGDAARQVGPLR